MEIVIKPPLIITEQEALLVALFRKYGVLSMPYGQVILHFADGELKKVERHEAVYKKT